MKFYVLTNPKVSDEAGQFITDFLDEEPSNLGKAPHCPLCGRLIGSRPWLPPYLIELRLWNREAGDIAFGPGEGLVISEYLKNIYEENGLNGFVSFHEVEIVKIKKYRFKRTDVVIPKYFFTPIARSRAAVDWIASEFEWEGTPPTCDECREGNIKKRGKRIIIKENSWSGEDIFYARGIGRILVSERFRTVCFDNKIKNAHFIPAEVFSFDFYPWEKSNDSKGS